MSARRVVTVGFQLALADAKHENFRSKASMLDWDVILFRPDITDFYASETYRGKPCLNDSESFQLRESCEHWRRELKQAVEAGKTVFVYLCPLRAVYAATGEKKYSGTGRNEKTTRIVDEYDNYKSIPVSLSPVLASGSAMKLKSPGGDALKLYWKEFEPISNYETLLTHEKVPASIVTRTGDKAVGAIYRTNGSGHLILLPNIDFHSDKFITEKGNWTQRASQIAAKLVSALADMDRTLRNQGEVTPEPSWVKNDEYLLSPERDLARELLEVEQQVESAQKRKEAVQEKLKDAGMFRALLFETGKPLENAIIGVLRLLGFTASSYLDQQSEFDVVFESDEGRLIGEAEGKDSKAINIDKLRQLSMNVHEDLLRDNVDKPAKPVLFGNAQRLMPIADRSNPFTEKCHTAAAASSTALVFTPDLFVVAQYLVERSDTAFARLCREKILATTGRVVFPDVPRAAEEPELPSGRD